MEGRTYHRVFSTDTTEYDHPAYWLLYDASGRSRAAHARNLPDHYVEAVRFDLEEHNDLYRTYRNFAQYEPDFEDAYIELSDPGSGDEIAALYHVGSAPRSNARCIYIQRASDARPSPIPICHPLYEPLQYPLLFPHATPGWGESLHSTQKWSQCEYYKARLLTEPRFHVFSRLACEWMCDMYSRIEDQRLEYIRAGKRHEAHAFPSHNLNADNVAEDEDDDEYMDSFTLPASFTGSPRFYSERVADALALARQKGKPDLMVTATCNPNWPEIRLHLRNGQSAVEVPQITTRVFKASLILTRFQPLLTSFLLSGASVAFDERN